MRKLKKEEREFLEGLNQGMRELLQTEGITQVALAKRLQLKTPSVNDCLTDPLRNWTMLNYFKWLNALGYSVQIAAKKKN